MASHYGSLINDLAYWRAQAAGLEYENKQLRALVESLIGVNLRPMEVSDGQTYNIASQPWQEFQEIAEENSDSSDDENEDEDEEKEDDSFDAVEFDYDEILEAQEDFGGFEATDFNDQDDTKDLEDYLNFMRISEEHKKDRDTCRKQTEKQGNEDLVVDFEDLKAEMKELYGARADEVHEAETLAQMRFNKFCDVKRAKAWPILPFRR